MNSSDLNELRAQLAPTLSALEAERTQQARTCATTAIICVILGLTGLVFVYSMGGILKIFMIGPPLIAGAIYAFIASNAKKSYGVGFKIMVMPRLVTLFGDLSYSAQSGLSEAEFNTANLFQRPDRYNCEDLIAGQIGATRVRMSEVHAEDRQDRTDSEGRTTTDYVTIFYGLFLIADFNKNFTGFTYVVPEGISGSLGSFGRGIQSLGGKLGGRGALVQLEDPEFERAFVTYSNDQTEARYILSSVLMRRLLKLKQHFNGNVSAAFIGGSLYLMIAKKENWFEPPGLNTPLTFEGVETTLHQLQAATGIIAELDLNTRIWSKQ